MEPQTLFFDYYTGSNAYDLTELGLWVLQNGEPYFTDANGFGVEAFDGFDFFRVVFDGVGFTYDDTGPLTGIIDKVSIAIGNTLLLEMQGFDATVAEVGDVLAAAADSGSDRPLVDFLNSYRHDILGSVEADNLGASDNNDIVRAGDGDDIVNAYFGNDTVFGNLGNDFIVGSRGDDKLYGGNETYDGAVNDGADTLIGGDGNDTLDGGTNPEGASGQGDVMLGGDGNDLYYVDSALDVVDEGILVPEYGFGGFDTVRTSANFFWDYYSVGEQVIVEEFADNPGGFGVTVVGGIFDNTLFGHAGTDILFGRGGNDVYIAGDGIDWMSLSTLGLTDGNAYTGVNGINTVVVEQRQTGDFSYDIVFDFESGWDYFDVRDYGYTSATQIFDRGFNDGYGNCWFALGDGLDYLYIVGLEKEDLLLSDFQVA